MDLAIADYSKALEIDNKTNNKSWLFIYFWTTNINQRLAGTYAYLPLKWSIDSLTPKNSIILS
jgi:hypothetical protein